MPINPLVLELLKEVIESGRSAEDACKDRPELLGEVRACLRQFDRVGDELDALFPQDHEAVPALPSGPLILPEIPGYAVGEILGRGGMGVVYKARHLSLNRPVALKMMLNGAFAGPSELARFRREAEAIAALEHPNIVRVHDVGESGGLPYFTMELADGGNLAQKLGGTPQPARSAAALMVLLAGAVEAAHRGGIVHRDLKPSNILLTSGGTPKITDFGLARRFEAGAGLSMTGARIGTPAYMAPEQAAGLARVSGAATDVYALGAILYELLTGRPPFLAATAAETERQVIAEEPAPPSRLNAHVPRDLETICLKCLQKEAKRRYASAADLGDDLGKFLRGEPIAARPAGWIERAIKRMRRHPGRTVTLFAGLTISVAVLIGGWYVISARSLVRHAVEIDLGVATQALRRSDWDEADSALERTRARLGPGGPDELRRRLVQAGHDLELVGRLAAIRMDRISRTEQGTAGWAVAYEKAFLAAGLLDMDEAPRAAADRLGRSDVKDALVAAIDDWSLCANNIADARREAWLLEVARRIDPDPNGWRDRLRDPSVRRDKQELARLAGSAEIAKTPVNLLASLGELLEGSGGNAAPFLVSVQRQHPNDLWVNYLLGTWAQNRDDTSESLRYLQAALATRPGTAFLHQNLGLTLARADRMAEALPYFIEASRLDPGGVLIRHHLGRCLLIMDRPAEAAEQFERGLDLARDASERTSFQKELRRCRILLGDINEADEFWKKSIAAKPLDHDAWDGYAELCLFQGRQDEYRTVCRGLIEQFGATEDPHVAERTGRACLLSPASTEALEKATALIDRALAHQKVKPDWGGPYYMFAKGLAEYRHGRLVSSIAIMDGPASTAMQPAPRLITAMALHRLGRDEEGLKTLAAAIRMGDWEKSRAAEREKWIYHILRREAEALILPNLPAFLEGKYRPRSNDEKLCLLGACQFEGRYRAAAELYAEILASDAHLADDLNAGVRHLAACSAALAGAGRGQDAGGLDESARTRWRNQARDWLRAELASARTLSKSNPSAGRKFLETTLSNWTSAPDLAGLRDPAACKGLGPSELKEFQALCQAVKALIAETKN